MSTYSADDLELDLRWWAAANYLTVGQIYLRDNPLLREPLALEHVKPRLLGHWGTSPGLAMIYALLNRVIRETDTDWLYVTGPGQDPARFAETGLVPLTPEFQQAAQASLAGIGTDATTFGPCAPRPPHTGGAGPSHRHGTYASLPVPDRHDAHVWRGPGGTAPPRRRRARADRRARAGRRGPRGR